MERYWNEVYIGLILCNTCEDAKLMKIQVIPANPFKKSRSKQNLWSNRITDYFLPPVSADSTGNP
jgi:hypothetical protein